MPLLRTRLLQKLKRPLPPPQRLWRSQRLQLALLLWVVMLWLWLGIANIWVIELKDVILALLLGLGGVALSLLSWGSRQVLEQRPQPLAQTEDMAALATLIFEPAGADEAGVRTLRRLKLRSSREVRQGSTPALARAMTLLNCRLFQRSVHGQAFAAKLRRNLSHVDQNRYVIRLLGMNAVGRQRLSSQLADGGSTLTEEEALPWVGFSHILPITQETYRHYIRQQEGEQGIEDTAFAGQLICKPSEVAHAFLIFTVALDGYRIKRWEMGGRPGLRQRILTFFNRLANTPRSHIKRAEQELYVMAFEHLRELSRYHLGANREALVLAQAFGRRAAKSLQQLGFVEQRHVQTADEEPLYQLRLHFPRE